MKIQEPTKCISKHYLHEALTRKGWFLPSVKGSFVNVKYLDSVFRGKVWTPKYCELRMAPCPTPPDTRVLLTEVQ